MTGGDFRFKLSACQIGDFAKTMLNYKEKVNKQVTLLFFFILWKICLVHTLIFALLFNFDRRLYVFCNLRIIS